MDTLEHISERKKKKAQQRKKELLQCVWSAIHYVLMTKRVTKRYKGKGIFKKHWPFFFPLFLREENDTIQVVYVQNK